MVLLAGPVGELRQLRLDLPVALVDLAMVELVQVVGLPQLEEVLGPPCPLQRQGDLAPRALMALRMAQPGQLHGVAFPVQDGAR